MQEMSEERKKEVIETIARVIRSGGSLNDIIETTRLTQNEVLGVFDDMIKKYTKNEAKS